LSTTLFNAGPSVIEALYAGRLDIAYIGPNPAITGFVRSGGEALRIVAGATSGGAALVVRPDAGISTLEELDGHRIATPQLGNDTGRGPQELPYGTRPVSPGRGGHRADHTNGKPSDT